MVFRYLLLLGTFFLFKIHAVSRLSYMSLSLSSNYLFLTNAVWLNEIRSGNISFNRVANAFKSNFKYVFSKDISLQLLINLSPLCFISTNFIKISFWELFSSSFVKTSLMMSAVELWHHPKVLHKSLLKIHHCQVFCHFPLT